MNLAITLFQPFHYQRNERIIVDSEKLTHVRITSSERVNHLGTIMTDEQLFTSVNFNMQLQMTTLFEHVVTIKRFRRSCKIVRDLDFKDSP